MKKKTNVNSSLPALILTFALLIFWQAAAMGVNAAYILPSPVQILQKLWELREPLFLAHLLGQGTGYGADYLFPDHHYGV